MRLCDPRILDRIGKGALMRKLCRAYCRRAVDTNPVWKHELIDFEGIAREQCPQVQEGYRDLPFQVPREMPDP
jgi:hypothetical protein